MSSYDYFISILHKQFYSLAYDQTTMIKWLQVRQLKGQNVQASTQEFKKKSWESKIPLHTRETIRKYIVGLHSYLRHTILMINHSNINEVSVKTTHLESSKGKK